MKDLDSVKELIKQHVTLGELLRAKGRITNTMDEEQLSCLFHGADRKKSARYYRQTDSMYCWTCKKSWDVFSYTEQMESLNFAQTLNYLIKTYGVDISHLPDAPEENIRRMKMPETVKVNNRLIQLERLGQAIAAVRDEIPMERYVRFAYSFMMLKYAIPEKSFQEQYVKVREGMLKTLEQSGK